MTENFGLKMKILALDQDNSNFNFEQMGFVWISGIHNFNCPFPAVAFPVSSGSIHSYKIKTWKILEKLRILYFGTS